MCNKNSHYVYEIIRIHSMRRKILVDMNISIYFKFSNFKDENHDERIQ